MADKTAYVRLTLNEAAFIQGMRKVGNEVDRVKQKTSGITGGMGVAAWKGAGDSVKQLGSQIANTTGMALRFGTALVSVGSIKSALNMKEGFEDLANRLKAGGDAGAEWSGVMKEVRSNARATGQTSGEMTAAYNELITTLGPAGRQTGFFDAALKAAGNQATVFSGNVTTLAGLAGILNKQFRIGKEDIGDEMAAMAEFGNRGGLTTDEMSEKLSIMGAAAQMAGMRGSKGLHEMIGWVIKGSPQFGNMRKAIMGVSEFMAGFETKQAQLKKKFGRDIKFVDADGEKRAFTDVLSDILRKGPKARKELTSGISTAQAQALGVLLDPFDAAVKAAKAAGKSEKEATAIGVKAYEEGLAKAGQTHWNAAKMQEEAADRMKDVETSLRRSKAAITGAFLNKDFLDAIESAATKLPAIAKPFGQAIALGVEHPLKAGGVLIGGKIAMGMAGGATHAIGQNIANAMKSSPVWAQIGSLLGKSAGIMIAAAVAHEVGKNLIDKAIDKQGKDMSKKALADTLGGSSAVSTANTWKMLAGEKERLAKIERDKRMPTGGAMPGLPGMGPMAPKSAAEVARDPEVQKARANIARMEAELHRREEKSRLEREMGTATGTRVPGDKPPSAEHVGDAVSKALRQQPLLVRIANFPMGGPGGAPAPGSFPPPQPGYAPR